MQPTAANDAGAPSTMNRTEAIQGQPQEEIMLTPGTTINDWRIISKLGAGVFGAVYKCSKTRATDNNRTANEEYAIKLEKASHAVNLLAIEVAVYDALQQNPNETRRHYPIMLERGQWQNYNFIVMSLVGKSLQDLRRKRPDNKFTLGTALIIARQTLEALSQLHRARYLHRDIKPANFAIGNGTDDGNIYILDFGMAREYAYRENGLLRLKRARVGRIGFRGTMKYASTHAHAALELCRGDDIQSWFYMVCEFIKGKLPWHRLDEPRRIYDMKQGALQPEAGWETKKSSRRLLLGGTPRQFGTIIDKIASLKFYDNPPYQELAELIEDAINTTKSRRSPLDWQTTNTTRN